VLKAMALPALTPLFTTACGRGSKGTVRVAVVWSGWELAAFRQVLAAFTEHERWDVSVLSMGEDINAVLGSEVSKAAAPDVVMLPQPGLVTRYADRLVPIQRVAPELLGSYPPGWRALVQPGGQDLGIWFKAAHTSMVWYRKSTPSSGSSVPSVPGNWDEWQRTNQTLAGNGAAPLALGAAEGWVLNEWLSNVLLSLDREYYQRLAARTASWDSGATRTALRSIGEMWTQTGEFPKGIGGALLTQFEDSVLDVFARQDAAMVAEGDFSYPVINRYGAPGVQRAWFRFPPMSAYHERPILVGGDLAALLQPGRAGGKALIRWLANPAAAEIWASQGGLISVNLRSDNSVYRGLGYIVGDLDAVRDVRTGMDGFIAFKLSDILGGADGQGLWKVMQDFLAGLGDLGFSPDPAEVGRVVEDTVTALVAGQ
jgi:ABC-type glycerol-3-phosphate transport system substrate-binding protein